MIPLMENKMKWDRSKKKKFPDIEIEMSNTHYNGHDEKIMKEETPIQMIPLWSKQNADLASPNLGVKEHSFIIQSGDSGIESVQASPAQRMNKPCCSSTIEMYDIPGPSTSRRFSSVYLHPDRARFNYPSPVASSSRDHNGMEVIDFAIMDGGGNLSAASSDASSLSVPGSGGPGGHRYSVPWGRRRSSTWTGRYSDATEPEFADLQRMATRGSVGMHSLSDSLHKLTFTQSLAFPELARKLANRRRQEQLRAAINDNSQDDFEACSKFVAVAGGFLLSLMVYCVVNKYAMNATTAATGYADVIASATQIYASGPPPVPGLHVASNDGSASGGGRSRSLWNYIIPTDVTTNKSRKGDRGNDQNGSPGKDRGKGPYTHRGRRDLGGRPDDNRGRSGLGGGPDDDNRGRSDRGGRPDGDHGGGRGGSSDDDHGGGISVDDHGGGDRGGNLDDDYGTGDRGGSPNNDRGNDQGSDANDNR